MRRLKVLLQVRVIQKGGRRLSRLKGRREGSHHQTEGHREQCDQIEILIVLYLAIKSKEHLHNSIKKLPKCAKNNVKY